MTDHQRHRPARMFEKFIAGADNDSRSLFGIFDHDHSRSRALETKFVPHGGCRDPSNIVPRILLAHRICKDAPQLIVAGLLANVRGIFFLPGQGDG